MVHLCSRICHFVDHSLVLKIFSKKFQEIWLVVQTIKTCWLLCILKAACKMLTRNYWKIDIDACHRGTIFFSSSSRIQNCVLSYRTRKFFLVNILIVKELSVRGAESQKTLLLKKPYPLQLVTRGAHKICAWVTRNLHDLSWNSDIHDYIFHF